jgi:hypothetical protein
MNAALLLFETLSRVSYVMLQLFALRFHKDDLL